jgi:uncharacterized protein YbaP (TraB family)
MASLLIAAAIAAASVPPVPAPAAPTIEIPDSDPAIWVVNDQDTVIYLFGTFHALDGRTAWFNDEIQTAFDASDELVLETVIPDQAALAPRPAPALSLRPSPLATASGSFLSSTRMAISAGKARGMNVANGADVILRQAAEAAGKPVSGLESFEYQLSMFGRVAAQPATASGPKQDLSSVGNLAIVMGQMQSAWNRGDSEIFEIMLDQMRVNSPASYDTMFTQRNSNWAAWIANRLQHPGTVFVAVGAGHLAGSDSVQAKLAQLGVHSARIN